MQCTSEMQRLTPDCLVCMNADGVIPIIYDISPALRNQQRKGKLVIGDVKNREETWYCKNCGSKW